MPTLEPAPAPRAEPEVASLAPPPAVPIAPARRLDLPVPKHQAAVVWLPAGSEKARLVVATHGAGGTPEEACDAWRELLGEDHVLLCPRGVTVDVYAPPDQRAYFYSDHHALRAEVLAAIQSLEAAFPDRVDPAGAIYTAFSQGAVMGALAFTPSPAPFVAMVLVEGGDSAWSAANARAFREGGGRRALFVCGRPVCATAAPGAARRLNDAGVLAHAVVAIGAGHTLEGAVGAAVIADRGFVLGDESP
jgi:hypothetical protein